MKKYIYIAGQQKTLIAAYLKIGTFTESYCYFTKTPRPKFVNFRNRLNAEYWVSETEISVMNDLGRKYLRQGFAPRVIKDIRKHNGIAWKLVRELNKLDLEQLSNAGLFVLFDRVCNALLKMMGTLFLSQDVYTKSVEEKLLRLLGNELHGERDVEKYFDILIKGYKRNAIQQEQTNWYHYVIKHRDMNREALMKYIMHNGWLIYNTFTLQEAYDFVRQRYAATRKLRRKGIQKEIRKVRREEESRHKYFIKHTKQLSRQARTLAQTLRDLTYTRLEVKLANNSLEVALNLRLLHALAQKFRINFRDLLEAYFPEDIKRLLKSGDRVPKSEIGRRYYFVSFIGRNGSVKTQSGKGAENEVHNILKYSLPGKGQDSLVGQVASRGNVRGVARVIELGDSERLKADIKRFRKREIMVTIMTQPNMMPLAHKSAGIITDEGGICSHAAIISRELRIPCIVGTGLATRVIKDGDTVELDGDRGIVKVTQRAD